MSFCWRVICKLLWYITQNASGSSVGGKSKTMRIIACTVSYTPPGKRNTWKTKQLNGASRQHMHQVLPCLHFSAFFIIALLLWQNCRHSKSWENEISDVIQHPRKTGIFFISHWGILLNREQQYWIISIKICGELIIILNSGVQLCITGLVLLPQYRHALPFSHHLVYSRRSQAHRSDKRPAGGDVHHFEAAVSCRGIQ